MTDHNELLETARNLATDVEQHLSEDGVAQMIRDLVNLVEKYDREQPELLATLERCETTIRNVVRECDQSTAELAAACKTCDEALEEILYWPVALRETDTDTEHWAKFRAARKLAQVAVANYEKAEDGGAARQPPWLYACPMCGGSGAKVKAKGGA